MKNCSIKITLLAVLLISCFSGSSQIDSLKSNQGKFELRFGAAFGPESQLAIPKYGMSYRVYQSARLENRVGIEGSAWILFTFFYSANVFNSLEYRLNSEKASHNFSLLLDNSFGVFNEPRTDFGTGNFVGPFTHFSYTPKIGLSYAFFQVKLGNSFFIWKNYDTRLNLLKYRNLNINVEASFFLKL